MHLKSPYTLADLKKKVEERMLPVLRKQNGFRDELLFASGDGTEAISISLWDRKDNAEAYSRTVYPQVLQELVTMFVGSPNVKTYEVLTSGQKFAQAT
jgi:hypothetical protein